VFVQVIKGSVSDPTAVRDALDGWVRDLAPGAEGWLGTTAGVTEDGTLIVLARFDSAEAARRNNDRPEQDRWWQQTSQLFRGEPTFLDTEDIDTYSGGGSDDARFLQVMEGRVLDRARADALVKEMESEMAERRPDILGGVTAVQPDGTYVDVVYFRSEAEAREGEKNMSPDAAEQMDGIWQIDAFYDLRDPWLYSP
jgi:hypothetical protein